MTRCACSGDTKYHRGPCEMETDKFFSPDMDIKPVALCDVCLFGCIPELAQKEASSPRAHHAL